MGSFRVLYLVGVGLGDRGVRRTGVAREQSEHVYDCISDQITAAKYNRPRRLKTTPGAREETKLCSPGFATQYRHSNYAKEGRRKHSLWVDTVQSI